MATWLWDDGRAAVVDEQRSLLWRRNDGDRRPARRHLGGDDSDRDGRGGAAAAARGCPYAGMDSAAALRAADRRGARPESGRRGGTGTSTLSSIQPEGARARTWRWTAPLADVRTRVSEALRWGPGAPENGRDRTDEQLNPRNYMPPSISQERDAAQTAPLDTTRERSSIPRRDTNDYWEYPSPQQMYNALLRKGYADTEEEAVPSMVQVHNYLNEGAWNEVLRWEQRHPSSEPPSLARFEGRPGVRSPKSHFFSLLGRLFPASFSSAPPFDRHDWYVLRGGEDGKEVRYVIDYYSTSGGHDDEQVFFLDVRPAIDSPTALWDRIAVATAKLWNKTSGAQDTESGAR